MTNPICQLMEDIEGLCKRCYHLQKSNNDMYGKDEEREGDCLSFDSYAYPVEF